MRLLTFYHGTGAQDFELLVAAVPDDDWTALKSAAVKLLQTRKELRAAELLREIPFELRRGTNVFGDDFTLLYASVGLDEYVRLAEIEEDKSNRIEFTLVADTISEIGAYPYVRFVKAELNTKMVAGLVDELTPKIASKTVERALRDAQQLLRSSGAVSAVDRAHTALHGYLRGICESVGANPAADAGMTELFKIVRSEHPAFRQTLHSTEITRILPVPWCRIRVSQYAAKPRERCPSKRRIARRSRGGSGFELRKDASSLLGRQDSVRFGSRQPVYREGCQTFALLLSATS